VKLNRNMLVDRHNAIMGEQVALPNMYTTSLNNRLRDFRHDFNVLIKEEKQAEAQNLLTDAYPEQGMRYDDLLLTLGMRKKKWK
jgi:hypothetical protein